MPSCQPTVHLCQDFSEESIRAVLDFLTFGTSIRMDLRLASEVQSFLVGGLGLTSGFKIDGLGLQPLGQSEVKGTHASQWVSHI